MMSCRIHHLLGAVLISAAATASIAQPKTTRSTTIQCTSADAGGCHILLYFSECKDGPLSNGKVSLVCTLSFWQEFTLKVGEGRKIESTTKSFKQCHQIGNERPVFPACAR